MKSTNNNNLLNQIIAGDKKNNNKKETNDGDNISFEVKVLFKRKFNKDNENYLNRDGAKKLEQIQMENNINNNNNKNKFPHDNIKRQPEKNKISKKNINIKKNKTNKDNKILINDFIKKEEEKEHKIKYENIDTGKVIFNNIFKKKSIEKKQNNIDFKQPTISDETLESILLLKTKNKLKKSNISSEDLIDFNQKKELINNKEFYLYHINSEKYNIDETEYYSTSDDYDKIIKNNIQDKVYLSQKLLQLEKRNWYNELKLASDEFKNRKDKNKKDDSLYFYLRNIIKIYEHFNWIINSISTYYNMLFQNKKFEYNFLKENTLPDNNSKLWNQGFDWKGLYIIALPESKSISIKNEIKAMKYCFYDFIQILEKQNDNIDKILTDEIIFPLIGYSNVNGIIIYVSVLINPDESFNKDKNFTSLFLNEIISHNKGVINYYSNNIYNNSYTSSNITTKDDENSKQARKKIYDLIGKIEQNYYTENLLESKLFMNMSEFHLIPYLGGKFILINAYKLVPNLFEIKFKNSQKINIYSEINHSKFYDTYLYNSKEKSYYNQNTQNIFLKSKELLDNYKLSIFNQIKVNDIIINKVHFRILYENITNIIDTNDNRTYKNRRFIDNIINYGYNYLDNEFKDMKYIGEHYLIIYDLVEPLKLEYSLMKEIKIPNDTNKKKIPFYIESNYISYFLAWCGMLNKNSYNIKTYSELKYSMKKFGINSNLKFFALMNINNEEITDIIKISILVKLIKYIYKQQNTNINYNNKTKYLFEDEKIGKIFFLIRCILYLNELSVNESNERNKIENIYEGLIFYTNIFFCKMRLIDDYLSLGLFKNNILKELNQNLSKNISNIKEEIDTIKLFLLNIIYTARKKPFLFLSELELKLNFIINPFIKFKSSISIESMNKKLKLDHINLNNYFTIFSYINIEEISGFILAKLIKDNKAKEINEQSSSSDDGSVLYYEENDNKKGSFKFEDVEKYETKSYNKNINEQNKSKNSIHSRKSSIPQSPNRIKVKFLEKKSSNILWTNIGENINIMLPPLCYKMKFEFELGQSQNILLKDNYHIYDTKIFFEHYSKMDSILKNIYSCNGKVESTLFHSLIPIYIITFFVEKNNEDSKNILKRISQIYSSRCYYLSLSDILLINLFQGLSCEGYLESEEPYSKCVMLFLMLFGDPRGRYNDSHPLMQLPL